jgi:hypothetical protein
MPITKVTKSLITSVDVSQINTSAGDAGKVLTSNGSTLNWVASSSIGSTGITRGTAVPLTNQTSVDFTGIPSTAKRITVMLKGISTGGTSVPRIQVGAGTVQTSNYLGSITTLGSGVTTANISTGVPFSAVSTWAITNFMHGNIIFNYLDNNIWSFNGHLGYSDNAGGTGGTAAVNGSITLAGNLDRIRLTTANGTDAFDAGTVNIMWE